MNVRIIAVTVVTSLCFVLAGGTAQAASDQHLSADEAKSQVARFFPIGETRLLSSRLVEPVNPGENPSWNLVFENGNTALVDSVTGNVKQWASVPNAQTAQGNLTADQARQIALRLIAGMYPDYASQVVPDPIRPARPSGAGVQVLFTRTANGALFPANGFQVNLNPDGSVAAFQTHWQENIEFPKASNLIGEQLAIRKAGSLLTSNPRAYLFYQIVAQDQPPKLFYLVKTATAEMALDAQTGEPPGGMPAEFKPTSTRAPYLGGTALILWMVTVALSYWMGKRQGLRRHQLRGIHPQPADWGGDMVS